MKKNQSTDKDTFFTLLNKAIKPEQEEVQKHEKKNAEHCSEK